MSCHSEQSEDELLSEAKNLNTQVDVTRSFALLRMTL